MLGNKKKRLVLYTYLTLSRYFLQFKLFVDSSLFVDFVAYLLYHQRIQGNKWPYGLMQQTRYSRNKVQKNQQHFDDPRTKTLAPTNKNDSTVTSISQNIALFTIVMNTIKL